MGCVCQGLNGGSTRKRGGPSHYLLGNDALIAEVAGHALDELDLLVRAEAGDGRLEHGSEVHLVESDEGVIVHVGEEAHDELAVHAVRHAAVSGDGVAKVFDLEGALEARGEEAAKGGDEGGEGGQDEGVELHGGNRKGDVGLAREEEEMGQMVGARQEDGVGIALEAGEDVGAEVLGVGESVEKREGERVGEREREKSGWISLH